MKALKDQHFLIDARAVRRIAGIIDVKDRVVLEIGPGTGVLTRALLDRGAVVRAVEIDPALIEDLELFFADEIEEGRFQLFRGDAARCELPPFEMVVSNLPYSASSRITFRLLDVGFDEAVLMYQAEFARRMVSPAGTPDCGRLSIMIQTYCCVERCFDLPPPVLLAAAPGEVNCGPPETQGADLSHTRPTALRRRGTGTFLPPEKDGQERPPEFCRNASGRRRRKDALCTSRRDPLFEA
jgi:phospholipid N-methyltransferase